MAPSPSYTSLVATAESANADLVKALQGMNLVDGVSEPTIVEYKPSDKTKVLAFVIRYSHQPKVEGITGGYESADKYYEESVDSVLSYMKEKEFTEMLEKKEKEIAKTVELVDRTIKMCDPKEFLK